MVELNHRDRTIKIKIVYYGPAVGGKTTNIQVLHQHAMATRRGEMVSIASAQDRTILFDLLPLKAAGFRGFDLRIQLLAVPGQAMYAATRRLVLKGADALVFVANSAADRWEENIQSFREMTQNLLAHQLDPASLPLALQYNKRDLPHVTPIEFMSRALNARNVDSIPAVAIRGEGVLETFSAILLRTMQDLATRYRIVETGKGLTLHQWTQQTIVGMFGTTSLALEPHALPLETGEQASAARPSPPAAPSAPSSPAPDPWPRPDRRTVRIALPEETARLDAAGPEARANETLVESYAQASAQLTTALDHVREERDLARSRLEDVHAALATAQEVLAGQPLEPTLRGILARMSAAGGATHATFLVPESKRTLRAAALRGVMEDPLLRVPVGVRHLVGKLSGQSEPQLHRSADNLDLGDALEAFQPPLAAVAAVPVRTPSGLQGLAMLYYTPDAVLPNPDVLAHLGTMSRALSASLELARALETVRQAERSLQLALAGTASVRGLQEIVVFLEDLRDRQGAMRHNPDVPAWFVDEFTRLAPSLAGALTTARSLLAFTRGEVQREAVGLQELMAELGSEAVVMRFEPGAEAVSGDPVLLRLALRALVDQARRAATGRSPGLEIHAQAEAGLVRIRVGGRNSAPSRTLSLEEPRAPMPLRGGADGELALVRRIAELHGGSLSLEADGDGSPRYTLTLVPA